MITDAVIPEHKCCVTNDAIYNVIKLKIGQCAQGLRHLWSLSIPIWNIIMIIAQTMLFCSILDLNQVRKNVIFDIIVIIVCFEQLRRHQYETGLVHQLLNHCNDTDHYCKCINEICQWLWCPFPAILCNIFMRWWDICATLSCKMLRYVVSNRPQKL